MDYSRTSAGCGWGSLVFLTKAHACFQRAAENHWRPLSTQALIPAQGPITACPHCPTGGPLPAGIVGRSPEYRISSQVFFFCTRQTHQPDISQL